MNMKKVVEIQWDKPKDKNWLCDENIKFALENCCKNTKFEVKEILPKTTTYKFYGLLDAKLTPADSGDILELSEGDVLEIIKQIEEKHI